MSNKVITFFYFFLDTLYVTPLLYIHIKVHRTINFSWIFCVDSYNFEQNIFDKNISQIFFFWNKFLRQNHQSNLHLSCETQMLLNLYHNCFPRKINGNLILKLYINYRKNFLKREKSEHQTLVLSNDVLLPENNFGFSLTVFSLVPMRTRQKRFFFSNAGT